VEPFAAFIGIDWADQQHAVCLVDARKVGFEHLMLDQRPEAIDDWTAKLRQRFPEGKLAVCLEQSRGALIYALMKYDCFVLFPVNPLQLARYREALGPSGAKDDPTDARLLVEFLQKHGDRLKAWKPDDAASRLLRLLVEDRRGLVDQRTAFSNSMKSRLKQYFPLALQMFNDIGGNLACAFLSRWSSFDQLRGATEQQLRDFYHEHECYRTAVIDKRIQAFQTAQALTSDEAIVESGMLQTGTLVRQIADLNQAIDRYDTRIAKLMEQHDDGPLFTSFPGAGDAMAPRLLAAFGTDRDRLENAQQLQQQVGVAPVTKRSGNTKIVNRRWACNKFLLQTFHEFAGHSRAQSPWAQAYYDMMRSRGHAHQAAVRALAFKWVRILYYCWKTRTLYDEATYVGSLIKRRSPIVSYLATTTE
jgi:transposase